MTRLIRLWDHTWINPDSVTSIVAYDAGEILDKTIPAHVRMKVGANTLTWEREDFEDAKAFVSQLAKLVNGDDE